MVRGESRHARHPQAAISFRTCFFGLSLAGSMARNPRCLGRGVFSSLRLHALLRPVRLHLCSARSVRLLPLRSAGELLSAACLLHVRLSAGEHHRAISAGNGCTPIALSVKPPQTGGGQPVTALRGGRSPKALRMRVARMGDTDESASALNRPEPGCAAERNAGSIRPSAAKLYLAAVPGDGNRTRGVRSKRTCPLAPATHFHRAPTLIGSRERGRPARFAPRSPQPADAPGRYSPTLALPPAGSIFAALAILAASARAASFLAPSPLPGWMSPADMMSFAAASTGMSSSMMALRAT